MKPVISQRIELNRLAQEIFFSNVDKYSTYYNVRFQMLVIIVEIQMRAKIANYLLVETLDKIMNIDENYTINPNVTDALERTREIQHFLNSIF